MNSIEPPVRFDDQGLVPVVTQDVDTGAVLMLGFMNADALDRTRTSGRVHYWSRGRAKLWKKGETSGHEQIVDSIAVNCEQNSLLIKVHQIGAVCHDGYPTCYYRRLENDGSLVVTSDRWFDPAIVYSAGSDVKVNLETLTTSWYSAYEFLRDHDLTHVSSTSRRLRSNESDCQHRIGEELTELAGVLDGAHRHGAFVDDAVLEGSQVLYWVAIAAIHERIEWDQLRPDRALITGDDRFPKMSIAKILRAEAIHWSTPASITPLSARLHAVVALVAQAARSAGIDPAVLIERDLRDLKTRPYLAEHFLSSTGM